MPYLMSTAFDELIKRITVDGDARSLAKTRRESIAELLKGNLETLDIFPTGSMVRGTGLKNVSDVDVIAVLHYSKHLKGKSCMQVLEMVRTALSGYNARIVKKNGQAVTLYFKTWPNVDLVPAKRVDLANGGHELHIPDSNTGNWIRTDPKKHDVAMASVPLRRRQLVRMIKCWNAAHSSYMRSFDIEQIAVGCDYATDRGDWTEEDWPWAILQFFEAAYDATEPGKRLSFEYDVDNWVELRSRLTRAKELALDAWYSTRHDDNETAMGKFQILFGDRFPGYG